MKQLFFILTAFLGLTALTVYGQTEKQNKDTVEIKTRGNYTKFIDGKPAYTTADTIKIITGGLPVVYGDINAQDGKEENKDRIIINSFGTTNEVRFTMFKDNLKKKVNDKFEIWTYTREGALIISKVKFNGKAVVIKTNRRKDKYATKRFGISKRKISTESVIETNTVRELIYF